jgi:phosphoglycerol transferase MdoB-like AlkP superfamily enzyme
VYSYVQMSLGVPWALYFVFLVLVTVPFAVMVLASGAARSTFLRVGLPLILVAVFAVVTLFVMNALQVTELMRTEKRAGPSLLSR